MTYFMVQRNPHFIHRPHDPLVIFAPSPLTSTGPIPLTNVSSVTDNERVSLVHDSHCLIVFQYRASQHKIVYNFAGVTRNETDFSESCSGACGVGVLATKCENELSNLFYGSYREGSGSAGVEVFHETCLAVYVVWPRFRVTPEWDRDLAIRRM